MTTKLKCNFCGKPEEEVTTLVRQQHICICENCVAVCVGIIATDGTIPVITKFIDDIRPHAVVAKNRIKEHNRIINGEEDYAHYSSATPETTNESHPA